MTMEGKKAKADIRPYTRQFYRENGFRFALAMVQIMLMTSSNLLISWMLQQIPDLIAGVDTGFSLPQLALLTAAGIGMIALAYACACFAKPRFISRAMSQYKNHVYEKLM